MLALLGSVDGLLNADNEWGGGSKTNGLVAIGEAVAIGANCGLYSLFRIGRYLRASGCGYDLRMCEANKQDHNQGRIRSDTSVL